MRRIDESKRNRTKGILLISACLFLVNPSSIRAQQVTEAALVDQLMKKLQERDQVISDLQRRVQQLEHRVGGVPPASESTRAAQPPAAPATIAGADQPPAAPQTKTVADQSSAVPPTKTVADQAPGGPPTKTAADQPFEQKAGNGAATQTSPAAVAQSTTGPGTFEVDEEAAERALERTLVQTGALLLPFGLAEIQPYVSYARINNEGSVLLRDGEGNIATVAETQNRRNHFEAGIFSRFGLPFGAQAELSIPAGVINASNVIGIINRETENTTVMFGDIRIGLAKTLMRESAWLPDIVGRITWDTDTGKQQTFNTTSAAGLAAPTSGLATLPSFNELIFSATALKRQDPLAFTSTVSYRKTFKKDGIEPGDVYGLTLGATLAASPQTSLSLGIQQSYIGNTRVFNNSIPGTDAISSIFTFGASSIIGKSLFFSAVAGIGLTKHSPDYFINVAVPLRFAVPFRKWGS